MSKNVYQKNLTYVKKYILYTRGGKIINKKKLSVQEWLPFEENFR